MERTESKWTNLVKSVDKTYEVTGSENSFARGLNIYKILLIFIIGSFAGFILETIWFILKYGELIERKGVFYGPYSPIYGVGMLMLAVFIHKGRLQDRSPGYVFVLSALFGSVFEYLCSLFQQILFGTRSWDYSGTFLSIDGRTNFMMAIMWGVIGCAFVFIAYPIMNRLIEKIPNKYGKIITIILTVFLVLDIGITALAVGRHKYREEGVPASNAVEKYLDEKYPSEFVDGFLQE